MFTISILLYLLFICIWVLSGQVEWGSPRLAMNLVAGTTQIILAYLISASLGLGTRMQIRVLLFFCIFSFIPLFLVFNEQPNITRGSLPSSMLQSITLQSPDQAIRLLLPLPRDPAEEMMVRTSLDRPYGGNSRLNVSVNGIFVGEMLPVGTVHRKTGFAISLEEIEVPFQTKIVGISNPMEIILRQSIPDPALRITIWGSHLGSTFGSEAAWFANGSNWVRGIPSSRTGEISYGIPIVWLLNIDL